MIYHDSPNGICLHRALLPVTLNTDATETASWQIFDILAVKGHIIMWFDLVACTASCILVRACVSSSCYLLVQCDHGQCG